MMPSEHIKIKLLNFIIHYVNANQSYSGPGMCFSCKVHGLYAGKGGKGNSTVNCHFM